MSALPWVLLLVVWLIIMRRMQGAGPKGIFSFGKSRAKMLNEGAPKVTFLDVAGADEAKMELMEIIEFLKEPTKFQKLGGKIPRGVLLLGPPGTGKTLLARAVAGEAGVPFFSISGADFVEMFVGVGASRVRDLFEQGKKSAPCIIFIDEIDAVGRHRGAGLGGGHDEREQTLNQLLVEMDGFEQNSGVIIIAATNRPDVLDPALMRPGRFDRQVVVDRPDVKGREGILRVHTKNIPLADDVKLEVLAKGTPGLAGADLANLVNEAALLAARQNARAVTMQHFEEAKDKVMMGMERKSLIISEKERKITSYHEIGHVLVARMLPEADPVHKVTIIPRGRALGSDDLPPDRREAHVLQGVPRDDDHVRPRRTRRGKTDLQRADHRRRQRHRTRDRARPEDGLRVGNERQARTARLRPEGRGDLPRPADHAAQELQRRDRHHHRRRDQEDRQHVHEARGEDPDGQHRHAPPPRGSAAGTGDPGRRGDRRRHPRRRASPVERRGNGRTPTAKPRHPRRTAAARQREMNELQKRRGRATRPSSSARGSICARSRSRSSTTSSPGTRRSRF